MQEQNTYNYKLIDKTQDIFDSIIEDIIQAKRYIYIETYKFGNDSVAVRFRDALIKKLEEGLEVKIIVDSWGTAVGESFFAKLIEGGGEVRFFRKLVLTLDFFTINHRRNHRKLVIIDDRISYISSNNYTEYSLNWRELALRIEGDIAIPLKKIFLQSRRIHNKLVYNRFFYSKTIKHRNFEIIRDIPTLTIQRIKNKYVKLINRAEKEVLIESPYFLPPGKIRNALIEAAERGVNVKIIIPQNSDMRVVDILRNRYLGKLYQGKVNILFFTQQNLHAKALMIDKEVFSIGSANIDYRSFRYMHEICLVGNDKKVIDLLVHHFSETMRFCVPFQYEKWLNRSRIEKLFELLLLPFRHLL